MEPVARLTGVSHRYGTVHALDDVTLDIPSGCMAGLIGPDGVGKSTLMALVAGVRRRQSGGIEVLGGDISSKRIRRANAPRVAYMPQGLGRNLYPTLTVRENLDFFGRLFGQGKAERDARIDMLLKATGLDPFPDRPAGKLSGGMKQKLSLCSALIHDPDLVILDEPTTGVDPLSRGQFWDLIDHIRADRPGMSVLTATAYLEEADRFDWLAAMDAGKVIASGTPDELREKGRGETLEQAFVNLLPDERRGDTSPIVLPPRKERGGAVPAIAATHLTMRFNDFIAVNDVSFTISEGEIFGFLGSNGCGKSTTMKMLTGLLTPTEGETKLFGEHMTSGDMESRLRIGYMSQSFSLYGELTVRQNLALHARLYAIPTGEREARIAAVLTEFDLEQVSEKLPEDLPLGIRQRLQLAVAVLHRPRVLILDEPTSGVDPVARDVFWRKLIRLSREDGVTIFISTHFMNEAERCDRISLMHAGKVLEVGAPTEIVARHGLPSLEAAFVEALAQEMGEAARPLTTASLDTPETRPSRLPALIRARAYAWRETLELMRDPIRLFFALAGPVILFITIGYGITFDVDELSFGVFDQDQSAESRMLADGFTAIKQFDETAPIDSADDLARRMGRGDLTMALEIPDGFGKALAKGEVPEVTVWVDGAMPFRAETARGYALGVINRIGDDLAIMAGGDAADTIDVQGRFLFNQTFKSANAMVPSVLMLILMLIPAIMTAVSVVREKETGTIANFRSTPVAQTEFLIGKQLPYIVIAWVSFWILVILGRWLFNVPFTGQIWAFGFVALIYVTATTGFGLLMSSFTATQVAAVFATAIIAITPTVNFSGLVVPTSALAPSGRAIGLSFPGAWFQQISVGSFVKAYQGADLLSPAVVLCLFASGYLILSVLGLRKQEK